jgi:hypothetical protein
MLVQKIRSGTVKILFLHIQGAMRLENPRKTNDYLCANAGAHPA